jgi:hypothetical protein
MEIVSGEIKGVIRSLINDSLALEEKLKEYIYEYENLL